MFLDKAKELCDECKEVSEEIEIRVSTKLHNLYNSTEVDGDEVVNRCECGGIVYKLLTSIGVVYQCKTCRTTYQNR